MVTRCIYKQPLKDLSEIDRKRVSPGGMPALPPVGCHGSTELTWADRGLRDVSGRRPWPQRCVAAKARHGRGLLGGAVEGGQCRLQDDSLGPDQGKR